MLPVLLGLNTGTQLFHFGLTIKEFWLDLSFQQMNMDTTPLEAGLDYFIKFDKVRLCTLFYKLSAR